MNLYKRGYLLFEMVVVLLCISALIILARTNSAFLNQLAVKAELEKLYAICLYLQQKAIASNTENSLLFNIEQNSYFYENNRESLPAMVKFGFLPLTKGPPSSPQKIIESPTTFSDQRIIFYPDGIIKAGTIYLIDQTKTCMFALSCPISQISYIRRYHYSNSWQPIT